VCALFDEPSRVEDDDPVHPRDRRESVRDGDDRPTLHHLVARVVDRRLGLRVQRRGGLGKVRYLQRATAGDKALKRVLYQSAFIAARCDPASTPTWAS
jgi:hypothetical protein